MAAWCLVFCIYCVNSWIFSRHSAPLRFRSPKPDPAMADSSFCCPLSRFTKPPTSFSFPGRRSQVKIAAFWALVQNGRTLLSALKTLFDELFTIRALALQLSAHRSAFSAYSHKISKKVRRNQVCAGTDEMPLLTKTGDSYAASRC